MSFLDEFEGLLKEKCLQNEPPFCTAACPFGLDVKDLVGKWKKGRFNAAYRTYANAVAFPEIVAAVCDAPCEKACLRAKRDGAVALRELERATVAHATRKKPNAYNLPAKGKRVAVVGGGISGLACTLFLCNKKYDVTVFEKTGRVGGHLWNVMDPEILRRDIRNQFSNEKYELRLETEILDLAELAEFDAVYVATGAGGPDFGLRLSGTGALASQRPGVFFGGSLCGRTSAEAVTDGLTASRAVERYLKAGLMNQPEERRSTRLRMDPAKLAVNPPVRAENGMFTEREAAAEAERCALCACDACMRECDLLRLFDKTPRRLYEEVFITIQPGTIDQEATWATRLISTCNQCGLCREACPERIDIGAFLRQSLRTMQAKGAMPWAFHDFWLRDMAMADGETALYVPPPGGAKPKYLFFPGCQLGASEPAYVEKSFAWLLSRQPESGLWLRCCGAPAEWAGEAELHGEKLRELRDRWEELGRPELIFGCATCREMFSRFLPEIPGSFLLERMAAWGIDPPAAPAGGKTCSVFDPCASRDAPPLQSSVRSLLEQMKIPLLPLSHEGRMARCCSFGGHTAIADPRYTREVAKARTEERDTVYIAYCANCRDTFARQGKEAYHILDLLFGLHGPDRPAPRLTERWENRRKLCRTLAEEYLGIRGEERKRVIDLVIGEELKERLSRDMILEEDMEEVVAWCEAEGRKLLVDGHFLGHKKIQNMTFWAEYAPEGDGFRLLNGYAHRMCLEEEA